MPRIGHLLSGDEKRFAEQYRRPVDATRFLLGRALARSVVAAHLDLQPANLTLRRHENGRLEVAEYESLHFNISHGGAIVAIAVADGCRVGVDVEPLSSAARIDTVARRVFGRREQARILALAGSQKERTLVELWTRKEALLKATGAGLACNLALVDTWADGAVPVVGEIADWTIHTQRLAGHVLTAAVQARGAMFEVREVTEFGRSSAIEETSRTPMRSKRPQAAARRASIKK